MALLLWVACFFSCSTSPAAITPSDLIPPHGLFLAKYDRGYYCSRESNMFLVVARLDVRALLLSSRSKAERKSYSRSGVFGQSSCRLGGRDRYAMVASPLLKYCWEMCITCALFSKFGCNIHKNKVFVRLRVNPQSICVSVGSYYPPAMHIWVEICIIAANTQTPPISKQNCNSGRFLSRRFLPIGKRQIYTDQSSFFSPRRRRPFLSSRFLVSIFPAPHGENTPQAESEAQQHIAVQKSAVRPCIHHVKPSWLSLTQTKRISSGSAWVGS